MTVALATPSANDFRFGNYSIWEQRITYEIGIRFAAMSIRAAEHEQRTFAAIPESARAARAFVGESLRQQTAPKSLILDYQLVISELITNTIEYGDGSRITVFCDFSDHQWWEIGVVGTTSISESRMKQPELWAVAGRENTSGRGLGIVRQLMDDIIADTTDDRVSVRCRRRRVEI